MLTIAMKKTADTNLTSPANTVGAVGVGIASDLEALARLRREGLLSVEEFNRAKQKLLS